MKFNAKLNVLLKSLGLKNSVISQIADVDASLISRFRSGIRTPKPDSPQLSKLCEGIITYSIDNSKTAIINSVCGFPSDMSDAVLLSALKVWLLNNQEITNVDVALLAEDSSPQYLKNFGRKLDSAMELLDLSNISLAKALDVDPSLVSRFRNGSRTPSTRNDSVREICAYLYNNAENQLKLNQFFSLVGINPAYLNNEKEAIIDYVTDWICDKKEISEYSAVSSFLNNLNWMTTNEPKFPPISELISDDIVNDTSSVYYGLEGFRRAFLRLSKLTLDAESQRPIYVYTDQSLDWIHSEKGYVDKVIMLLLMSLKRKDKIYLVHSMNHTPQDVFFEVERFLPLHATGQIESRYLSDGESRYFSQTLFVVPGVAAISASLVVGTEDVGGYHFFTNKDSIDYFTKQFEALYSNSKSLLTTIPKHADEIHSELTDLADIPGARITLQHSLPLNGLNEELFLSIIKSNSLCLEDEKNALRIFTDSRHNNNEKYTNKITEYVPLANISSIPSAEKMATSTISSLLNDPNYLMVPVNIGTINEETNTQIYYTREAYIAHVKAIIKVLQKYDNYNFVPIDYKPFRNLRLMLVEDHCVIASSNSSNVSTFLFNHSILNHMFEEYIYSLQNKKYKKKVAKDDSIKILNDYIRFW